MNVGRYKPTGWKGESYRHYLAAKGITTTRKYKAAKTAAGRLLERQFAVGEAQRRRVIAQGTAPVVEAAIAQRGAIKSPLTNFEEAERKEVLKGLGSGRASTLLGLADQWTPAIGGEEFEQASAGVAIAEKRREEVLNIAKSGVKDPAVAKELEDSAREVKVAKERKDVAAFVLNADKKSLAGTLNETKLGTKLRAAKGAQVKRNLAANERREERGDEA